MFFVLIVSSLVHAQEEKPVLFENDVELTIEPADRISTVSSEMSPAFVNNLLYFSAIPEKYFKNTSRRKKNTAFYQVFSATLDGNGQVSSGARSVSGFENEMHEGPLAFCEKTGELFVTLSNNINQQSNSNAEGMKRLRIVIMKQQNGRWNIVEEMPFASTNFNFAHPAVTPSGDTLIFSSDLDSLNYGKSDLFMSVRTNGTWGEPVNLGEYMNTPGSEVFPTFVKPGFLSFATDGRTVKKGGLDIYFTPFPQMNEIELLENDINSEFDDFSLIIDWEKKIGYFSSNRDEKNSDEIFMLKIE
jgi:hypothetical protein